MANLIEDITVAVATTQVDIDLISTPIEKGELYELECTFVNPNTDSNIGLFANDNVTQTNYYTQQLTAGDTTVSSTRTNENKITFAPNITKVSCYVKLTNDGKLVILAKGMYSIGGNQLQLLDRFVTSISTFTSVTKLSVISAVANAIGINSRIQLRKVATKVDEVIVGTATTQIDFTVDIGKGNEYLLVSDINNTSASVGNYSLFANNDLVETNYDQQLLLATSTTIVGGRDTKARILAVVGNRKSLVLTKVKLANSGIVNFQSNAIREVGEITPAIINYYISKDGVETSITKLTVKADIANQIGVASRFELYKLV